MAEKQTILGRIAQLAKANINALLDKAEDPQKMIDQLIRDYTNSIIEAENAIAQTLGNLRMAERDYEEDVKAAADWGQKAAAASAKADSLRTAGDEAGADKWDNLAKVALGKQIQFENEIKTEEPALATQRDVAERLKNGLAQMKDKLSELKSRRDQLIAREKTAKAQAQVTEALGSINILDPTSELGRFEDRVRQQEALAQGKMELAASSLDAQFAELQTDSSQVEIEARWAALLANHPLGCVVAPPPLFARRGAPGWARPVRHVGGNASTRGRGARVYRKDIGSKSSMSMMWSLGRRTWKACTSYSRSMISRPRSSSSWSWEERNSLKHMTATRRPWSRRVSIWGRKSASWLARMTSPLPSCAIASMVRWRPTSTTFMSAGPDRGMTE